MSEFQIPQILGIMTLFKNCQRFRDKYFASHQQESSLPGNIPSLHHTRSCIGAVAGIGEKNIWMQNHSCRHIPFHSINSVGQAHHWMLCSWGIRQQRFWPLSSETRTIYQDSIPGSSCAWGCFTQPNVKGCWSTRDSLSFTKTSDLDFQVLQGTVVLVMDCHVQTFWVWQEHASATLSTPHFFMPILNTWIYS